MGFAQRSSSTLRLLLVDKDAGARRTLRVALESRIPRPMLIMESAEPAAARALLADRRFDAIAADLDTIGGIPAVDDWLGRSSGTILYALGPASDVAQAVGAVRAGAADFIEKPLDGAAFARRIERQFPGTPPAGADPGFDGLIGQSAPMHALFEQITRVAPAVVPVFVTGESGTGKSLVARAVHARSRRRAGPFVSVDCSGRTAEELEADLAAPGGAIDRANGGTLHLDEVGHLPPPIQALLLRFVETGEIGGLADRRQSNVRLVASTNRTAAELTARGGLRPDLYFRLAVLTLDVPPLRDRREDVALLAEDLLRRAVLEAGGRHTRLAPAARDLLCDQDWPGNVRELRNVVERLVLRREGDLIGAEDVAAVLGVGQEGGADAAPSAAPRIRPLWMEEERLIEAAIAAFEGNVAKAAAALEISPSTIYRKRRPRTEGDDWPALACS